MYLIPANSEENINLLALANINLNLIRAGKNEFGIDSVQEATIREIATDCPITLATSYAQGLLSLVYGEEFSLACDTIINSNLKTSDPDINIQESIIQQDYFLLQNNPNPFSETTLIEYKLPENSNKAKLVICDITGKQLSEISLIEKTSSINISLKNYKPGVYLYSLVSNGMAIATKRMVLVK